MYNIPIELYSGLNFAFTAFFESDTIVYNKYSTLIKLDIYW